jgi:hypothetical protein
MTHHNQHGHAQQLPILEGIDQCDDCDRIYLERMLIPHRTQRLCEACLDHRHDLGLDA